MKLPASLHDRLKTQHLSIEPLIAGLSAGQLKHPPAPGKWSVHDNVAHLARYQVVFIERMESILADSNPSFGRYKAEDDRAFESWRAKPLAELLHTLKADRNRIIDRLTTLDEHMHNRTGTHPKFGNLTLSGWAEFFLLHEAHHIYTIFQLVHSSTAK